MTLQERAHKFEKHDDVLKELYSDEEIAQIKADAKSLSDALDELQDSISKIVAAYMAREGIGFSELTKRLGVSSRQTSKILKGNANLRLASLIELGNLLGKKVKVVFE